MLESFSCTWELPCQPTELGFLDCLSKGLPALPQAFMKHYTHKQRMAILAAEWIMVRAAESV